MKKETLYMATVVLFLVLFTPPFVFAEAPAGDNILSADNSGRISLDLKGMDVVEVLKTLATKGNMNVVVGTGVQGKVTMFLKDVDIRDAFEMILVANDLASDRQAGIIYVMTEREYEKIYGELYADKKEVRIVQLKYTKAAEAAKMLDQIRSRIGKIVVNEVSNTVVIMDSPQAAAKAAELLEKIDKPTSTRIYEFKYAIVKDIKDKVQELLTKGLGTLQIDERTNKLVITDLEDKLDEIEKVLTALDEKQQQVLIEAKILEVTLTDEYKLGIDWQLVTKEFHNQLNKSLGIRSSFKLASAGAFIPGGEILIGAFGVADYSALIQALSIVGDANTLSSPRITVMNNQEAKILVGSSEPYATNTVTQGTLSATTATTLTFMDVGVKLYVTPTINKDGCVTMKIRPEVSSKSGTYTYGSPSTTVPIVSTTQAETSVMVKDGATIIIAGLIRDDRSGAVNTVPFLSELPFVGEIFKNTANKIIKKELVIFMTPHIISSDTDYLKQPNTYPIGEKGFTMSEKLTFQRRNAKYIKPDYFKENLLYTGKIDPAAEAVKKRAKEALPVMPVTEEEYFSTIKNKIMQNVLLSREDKKILHDGDSVKVSFVLYAGGALASAPKAEEATNELLGRVVKEAVKKASPFPPFPESVKEPKKLFAIEMTYSPDSAGRGKRS